MKCDVFTLTIGQKIRSHVWLVTHIGIMRWHSSYTMISLHCRRAAPHCALPRRPQPGERCWVHHVSVGAGQHREAPTPIHVVKEKRNKIWAGDLQIFQLVIILKHSTVIQHRKKSYHTFSWCFWQLNVNIVWGFKERWIIADEDIDLKKTNIWMRFILFSRDSWEVVG